MSDYIAYYSEGTSQLFFSCIEDCELLKISKKDLLRLFDALPELERFSGGSWRMHSSLFNQESLPIPRAQQMNVMNSSSPNIPTSRNASRTTMLLPTWALHQRA
ncbi:unnamed protein product [Ectocarpus fasciculatus]